MLGQSGASGKGRSGIEHWVVFIILLILIGALLYALGFNMNGLR